jgi:hypothetical protein
MEISVREQERVRAEVDELVDVVLTYGLAEDVLHLLSTLSVTVSDMSLRRRQGEWRPESEMRCQC